MNGKGKLNTIKLQEKEFLKSGIVKQMISYFNVKLENGKTGFQLEK